jgi:hypothetical protein
MNYVALCLNNLKVWLFYIECAKLLQFNSVPSFACPIQTSIIIRSRNRKQTFILRPSCWLSFCKYGAMTNVLLLATLYYNSEFQYLQASIFHIGRKYNFYVKTEVSVKVWTAHLAERFEWVEVRSAGMKSRIPTEEYGLWDFTTFNTLQHVSCSNSQGMVSSPTHKDYLNSHFFILSKQ